MHSAPQRILHRRRRRGSVTLMVVSLLVIFGVLAFVFIIMSNADRRITAGQSRSQQVNLYLNMLDEMVTRYLHDDAFGGATSLMVPSDPLDPSSPAIPDHPNEIQGDKVYERYDAPGILEQGQHPWRWRFQDENLPTALAAKGDSGFRPFHHWLRSPFMERAANDPLRGYVTWRDVAAKPVRNAGGQIRLEPDTNWIDLPNRLPTGERIRIALYITDTGGLINVNSSGENSPRFASQQAYWPRVTRRYPLFRDIVQPDVRAGWYEPMVLHPSYGLQVIPDALQGNPMHGLFRGNTGELFTRGPVDYRRGGHAMLIDLIGMHSSLERAIRALGYGSTPLVDSSFFPDGADLIRTASGVVYDWQDEAELRYPGSVSSQTPSAAAAQMLWAGSSFTSPLELIVGQPAYRNTGYALPDGLRRYLTVLDRKNNKVPFYRVLPAEYSIVLTSSYEGHKGSTSPLVEAFNHRIMTHFDGFKPDLNPGVIGASISFNASVGSSSSVGTMLSRLDIGSPPANASSFTNLPGTNNAADSAGMNTTFTSPFSLRAPERFNMLLRGVMGATGWSSQQAGQWVVNYLDYCRPRPMEANNADEITSDYLRKRPLALAAPNDPHSDYHAGFAGNANHPHIYNYTVWPDPALVNQSTNADHPSRSGFNDPMLFLPTLHSVYQDVGHSAYLAQGPQPYIRSVNVTGEPNAADSDGSKNSNWPVTRMEIVLENPYNFPISLRRNGSSNFAIGLGRRSTVESVLTTAGSRSYATPRGLMFSGYRQISTGDRSDVRNGHTRYNISGNAITTELVDPTGWNDPVRRVKPPATLQPRRYIPIEAPGSGMLGQYTEPPYAAVVDLFNSSSQLPSDIILPPGGTYTVTITNITQDRNRFPVLGRLAPDGRYHVGWVNELPFELFDQEPGNDPLPPRRADTNMRFNNQNNGVLSNIVVVDRIGVDYGDGAKIDRFAEVEAGPAGRNLEIYLISEGWHFNNRKDRFESRCDTTIGGSSFVVDTWRFDGGWGSRSRSNLYRAATFGQLATQQANLNCLPPAKTGRPMRSIGELGRIFRFGPTQVRRMQLADLDALAFNGAFGIRYITGLPPSQQPFAPGATTEAQARMMIRQLIERSVLDRPMTEWQEAIFRQVDNNTISMNQAQARMTIDLRAGLPEIPDDLRTQQGISGAFGGDLAALAKEQNINVSPSLKLMGRKLERQPLLQSGSQLSSVLASFEPVSLSGIYRAQPTLPPYQSARLIWPDNFSSGSELVEWFTIYSPALDGIDNDGNGFVDDWTPRDRTLSGGQDRIDWGVRSEATGLYPVAGQINVNTAPKEVLERLPWPTELLTGSNNIVQQIVAEREENGPFRSLADLQARVRRRSTQSFKPGGPGMDFYAHDGQLNDTLKNPAVGYQSDPHNIARDHIFVAGLGGGSYRNQGQPPSNTASVFTDTQDEINYAFRTVGDLLTVRSDTFAAYAIVQFWIERGGDPDKFDPGIDEVTLERRTMSMWDRSLVGPRQMFARNQASLQADLPAAPGQVLHLEYAPPQILGRMTFTE